MSRVLVTGGAGPLGAAVVRRLLVDPSYEVRVSDRRAAPQWMREGCELHAGDLRVAREARAATDGCSHVIQLAASTGSMGAGREQPLTLMEDSTALCHAVIRAALELEVTRLVYVSSARVFERAERFPTPEEYLPQCPVALSGYGFSRLIGELSCRAAHEEHGLRYTICRPFDAYGPGELGHTQAGMARTVAELIEKTLAGQRPLEIYGSGTQTRTPTHMEDIAEGIVMAMSSPAALNEDFNLAAGHELTLAEIARIVWACCEEAPQEFELAHLRAPAQEVQRRCPSAEKAKRLLGWRARIEPREGIAATARWMRTMSGSRQQPIAGAR